MNLSVMGIVRSSRLPVVVFTFTFEAFLHLDSHVTCCFIIPDFRISQSVKLWIIYGEEFLSIRSMG